ncbi:protein unc-93 homolog A-like [Dermacentor variabilis]|uniref:protein unc-93 homolog A-like n=1 Tax=Dermacentor variabilis TaxID=34621 RepID=UPI003F5B0214
MQASSPGQGRPEPRGSVGVLSPAEAEGPCWDPRQRKQRLRRNLLVVSASSFLVNSAFLSLSHLQTNVLNVESGLGTVSLSAISSSFVLSCMFLAPFFISVAGLKITIGACTLLYTPYFIANFYPHWVTVLPTSFVLGFGAGPLCTANSAYVAELATQYAGLHRQNADAALGRFFGIFLMFGQLSQVFGNLLSYVVLGAGGATTDGTVGNQEASSDKRSSCGVNFCPQSALPTNITAPSVTSRFQLCVVYTAFGWIAALVVFLLLDPLERKVQRHDRASLQLLMLTMRHMKNPYQIFIIPLTIFSGLEIAFIADDFTKAYITCTWGVYYVGLFLVSLGVSGALFSLSFGWLLHLTGRPQMVLLGAVVNVAMIILMLSYETGYLLLVLLVASGVWGIADAAWTTHLISFYAVAFWQNPEAAFASCYLWRSVGTIAALSYSNLVCTDMKLYILLCVLTVGVAGYFAVDAEVKRAAAAAALPHATVVSATVTPIVSAAGLQPLAASRSLDAGIPVVIPALLTSNPVAAR